MSLLFNKEMDENFYYSLDTGNGCLFQNWLKSAKSRLNKTQRESYLSAAIYANRVEMAEELLKEGASPNGVPEVETISPLAVAIWERNLDAVKLLLNQKDIDVELGQKSGFHDSITPLELVIRMGFTDAMEILLQKGANVCPKHTMVNRLSPLFFTINQGNAARADVLLKYGADVNEANPYSGDTVLMFATQRQRVEMVEFLLRRGADVTHSNKEGKTAIDFAKSPQIRALLKKAKSESDCQKGMSPVCVQKGKTIKRKSSAQKENA